MKFTLLEAVRGLLERTYRIRTCLPDLGSFVIGDLGYRELYGSPRGDLDIGQLVPDAGVVKVSVIGVGMRSHAGVAKQMFQALADKGINIQVISTSEIKISVLIAEEYVELALRALHTAYGLDAD